MAKRKTTEEFIKQTKEIYGDLFSFDEKTVYLKNKTRVKIICKHHGYVEVQPDNFLNKHSGCPECAKNKNKTTEQFIEEAKKIHGDKWIYTNSIYINNHTKLLITCPIHGDFPITPSNHLHGKGCPKCCNNRYTHEERVVKLKMIILITPQ